MRKLTVDDIHDLRAYERERDGFRRTIIELKRARRVAIGPIEMKSLPLGKARRLTKTEVEALQRIAAKAPGRESNE